MGGVEMVGGALRWTVISSKDGQVLSPSPTSTRVQAPSATQEEGSMAILGPYSVADATVRPLQPVDWVHSRQYSQTSSLMLMCFSTGRKPCSLAIALWCARSRRW